jgi:hypothetical protein
LELTKRQMMLIPDVNPNSFVFFYAMGNSGTSWSIRDYSFENRVEQFGPRDFPWTVDAIHLKAKHSFNTQRVHTDNLAHWHKVTLELNLRFLGREAPADPTIKATTVLPASRTRGIAAHSSSAAVPMLNLPSLLSLPKGRKPQDMVRILHSPKSEDWVTWNFFQMLLEQHPSGWWSRMISAARRRNPDLDFSFDGQSLPEVKFWTLVSSPQGYQKQSRKRMMSSGTPLWIARAASPQPVEGPSEIDIAFEHDEFMVFIEAKLGSDISMSTTYDPQRNQIARNIDCLIDKAGARTPAFWLLARDEEPSRAYVQLMNSYRRDPSLLARELPHRNPETLDLIARNLTILRWSDFRDLVCGPAGDPETVAVTRELEHRILNAADMPKLLTA